MRQLWERLVRAPMGLGLGLGFIRQTGQPDSSAWTADAATITADTTTHTADGSAP